MTLCGVLVVEQRDASGGLAMRLLPGVSRHPSESMSQRVVDERTVRSVFAWVYEARSGVATIEDLAARLISSFHLTVGR